MIAERHYEDEALVSLLEKSGVEGASRDPHMASCRTCTETLDTFRMIARTLRDRDVWEPRELDSQPVPQTIAALRAFANDMTREDAHAEAYVAALLSGPREQWTANLAARPQYRTAGTVRKLIAALDRALDNMPPDAVEITALAVDVAEGLDPAAYASDVVARLRGTAWRERAYALVCVGSYREAEQAVCAAESHFSHCLIDEYDRARLDTMRAVVFRVQDRPDDALAAARRARVTLQQSGDTEKYVSAAHTEALALMKAMRYSDALAVLEETLACSGQRISDDARAGLLSTMGLCHRSLRNFGAAVEHYRHAAALFVELGNITASARLRANMAVVLRDAGRTDDALAQLREARREFARLGMAAEAALTDLGLAEILLEKSDLREVEALCRSAMAQFEAAGVAYGAAAMTALAYLREATQRQRVTTEHVRHVRNYIQRLPAQPALLFLPLPD